ncbi:hypothetical protein BDF22DRAFT_745707 [Syncephalis plumigaleata]|nr:hypothetical protein BDF22DRAFT_745707 [Syncephalis plumigaleata]
MIPYEDMQVKGFEYRLWNRVMVARLDFIQITNCLRSGTDVPTQLHPSAVASNHSRAGGQGHRGTKQ